MPPSNPKFGTRGMKRLQNGIYFKEDSFTISADSRNNCFAVMFLQISDGLPSQQVAEYLQDLWRMFRNLRKGFVSDLPGCRVPSDDLSVLLAYGPNTFGIPEVIKKIPRDFKGKQFRKPVPGEPILEGAGIRYGSDLPMNQGISDHLAIQFISKSQLATYRAVVETWKFTMRTMPLNKISVTTFYTGFQRNDRRSWLGFHDELSNMKNTVERKKAIVIDNFNNNLLHQDYWTAGGTYLAFLRLEINLAYWEKIGRRDQEFLIGRDKLTGIPLVGIDKKGNPLKRIGCPPSSEIQSYDKRFHDHPNYFQKPSLERNTEIDVDSSIRLLSQSHIGRTRHIDRIKSDDPASRRIFRQGFEFIESSYNNYANPLKTGLNFISFQNDPTRLLFILTDPSWLGGSNFGGTAQGMKDLLTVQACGIFFVPPAEKPFPGVSMFK